jgi:branched-chain amino acid transport system substrate-binding protein
MRAIHITLLGVALLILPACKPQEGEAPATQPSGEIVIGEYGSLTGKNAVFGQGTHHGIQMAVDEVNAAGGILGQKVKLISEDDRGDKDEAVAAVKKLIDQDNVLAILGEVASTRSMAGGAVCEQSHVPMISPSSTNPLVTIGKKYLFRVCFTDAFQGVVDAQFAAKQGWKHVAMLTCANADYSKKLAEYFKNTFQKTGDFVAEETYTDTDKDFSAQLTRIQSKNPDAVYIPGYYDSINLILKQARQDLGFKVPFFGGDGWDGVDLKLADGCYFTNHYSPDDNRQSVKVFIAAYKLKYNTDKAPDAFGITGYDAARVLFDSIKRAGKVNRDAIRDAIEQTKDFPGAGGGITIDANHDAKKPIVIVKVENGETHLADSIQPE